MNKSGIVVSTDKKIACLMSSDGQFVKVKIKGEVPGIGEVYCGEIHRSTHIYKNSLIAAALAFFVFLGGGMYTYYTPAAEITVDINPAVKLVLNRWKRIISVSALNKDGEKLLTSIKLNNKPLDEGLTLIVQQAKKDNYINEKYKASEEAISIHIDENKKLDIQLPKFEASVKEDALKYTITEVIRSNKENMNKLENKNVNNTDKIDKDKQNNNNGNVNTETSNKKQNSVDNAKEKEIIKNNKSNNDKKPASTDDKKEKNKYKNTNTRNKDSKEKDKDNSDKDKQNNKE